MTSRPGHDILGSLDSCHIMPDGSAADVTKAAASQAAKGKNSYYYWHGDAERRRQIAQEDPAPKPKHVLVKVEDRRVVVAGPPPPPSDEPWDDPPLPGGYILATPQERYTPAELFNWSKYISPPRGWPEAFTYFQPMKEFLAKRLKAQRVRLIEVPHPLELERLERTHFFVPTADDALHNAVSVRRLLGWPIVCGYILLEEAQGCGRKDAVNSALYHGEKHWWNVTARGVWVDVTPRRHKKLVLVQSAKVSSPAPTAAEEAAMAAPAERADEMVVSFIVGAIHVPNVRMTSRQLDTDGATFLTAVLDALERPYKLESARQPAPPVEDSDSDSDAEGGAAGAAVTTAAGRAVRGIDKHAIRTVTLDGAAVVGATTSAPRHLLTKPGRTVELGFFPDTPEGRRAVHVFRLFNLTLPRLVEAATLCFTRISKYAPPHQLPVMSRGQQSAC